MLNSRESKFFKDQNASNEAMKGKMQEILRIQKANNNYLPSSAPKKSLEKLDEKITEMRKIASAHG